jgi:hypothetical protein
MCDTEYVYDLLLVEPFRKRPVRKKKRTYGGNILKDIWGAGFEGAGHSDRAV